jgi:hypothetical protein
MGWLALPPLQRSIVFYVDTGSSRGLLVQQVVGDREPVLGHCGVDAEDGTADEGRRAWW